MPALGLGIKLGIAQTLHQMARLARDTWNSISLNDVWEREQRKWENIV
jgi:hypothetical protein